MTPFKGAQRVTSLFGYRTLNGYREHHNGIDVAISNGTWEIREVTGGTVVAVSKDYNGGRGWLVKVQTEPGVIEWYQHMSRIDVVAGQTVKQGTIIGVAGATGYSFGVHLHFEVQINGVPVEPSAWLGLPNILGTYAGNDNLDSVPPEPTPEPSPKPNPPVYPDAKYRLYRSIEAYESVGMAKSIFSNYKEDAQAEYILLAVGDGKWRIAQVYLATTNLDHAVNEMQADCIICGSDMSKYRVYKVESAHGTRATAINTYKAEAATAPNDVCLTNMGGDAKWRRGRSIMATESLDKAIAEVSTDNILC